MLISVDVEANGPSAATCDMISAGFVLIDGVFDKSLLVKTKPRQLVERFNPKAYELLGITKHDHMAFTTTYKDAAHEVVGWLQGLGKKGRAIIVSDNPAFDCQWISAMFAIAEIDNPFGWSARRIGDFYAGLKRDFYIGGDWKRLRETKHTHNPVDDARGNAEAVYKLIKASKNPEFKV